VKRHIPGLVLGVRRLSGERTDTRVSWGFPDPGFPIKKFINH